MNPRQKAKQELEEKARIFAIKAHQGQFRRDGETDYIVHPARVFDMVSHLPNAATAWLHDVLEDTETSDHDLRDAGFPEWLVQEVCMLTRHPDEDYWYYLDRINMAGPWIKKIKVADMLSNLLDDPTEAQRQKYIQAILKLL